jgi:hypothetical protein
MTTHAPGDTPLSWGLADAISANDGTAEDINWIDVPIAELDLIFTVPRMPLRMKINDRMMAVSASYAEQVRVCKLLGCVSPTHAWFQAIWRAAKVKLTPCPLVSTATDAMKMGDFDFLTRENDNFDKQIAANADALSDPTVFPRGFAKAWLMGILMGEQGAHGAENEGFEYPDGHELQHEGGMHNDSHLDYSQWIWDIIKRMAKKISTGEQVDLLELQRAQFPQFKARLDEYENAA